MAEPGQIRFSGVQARGFEGNFDTRTGKVSDFRLVDVNALEIQGQFNQRDLQRLQTELRNNVNADTTPQRERLADRVDANNANTRTDNPTTNPTTNVKPPEEYTQSGRYTEATTDADLREGFRGDRVRTEQQRLKDLGYDLGTHGVDGYWGKDTQKAWEQFQADTRNGTTRNNTTTNNTTGNNPQSNAQIDTLRNQADTRVRYTKDSPQQISNDLNRDFNRTNALGDPEPNVDNITRRMTEMNNDTIRRTDEELQRDGGDSLATRFDKMDDSPLGINDPFAIRGDNSDYIDFMKRNAGANRNEGNNAAANSPVTDEYQRSLLRARTDPTWGLSKGWGTDESSINHVFSRASGAQLAELDRRFKEGIKDEDGEVIKFENGLRGYIESEIGSGAHRDALLAQLDRPMR